MSHWRSSLLEGNVPRGNAFQPTNPAMRGSLLVDDAGSIPAQASSCYGLEYTCKNSYLPYNEKAARGCQTLRPSAQRQVMELSGRGHARCPEGFSSLAGGVWCRPDTQAHHVARPRALRLLPLWTAIQSQLGGAMNSREQRGARRCNSHLTVAGDPLGGPPGRNTNPAGQVPRRALSRPSERRSASANGRSAFRR